jgi:hypothetical protein
MNIITLIPIGLFQISTVIITTTGIQVGFTLENMHPGEIKLRNAISEEAYMIGPERNGDIIKMASYAPLLAKTGFTQWTSDLIFFDNVNIWPDKQKENHFTHESPVEKIRKEIIVKQEYLYRICGSVPGTE